MATHASLPSHLFNASTSSCSNDDIVIRGDIVEFLNRQRCGSCQSRGRDCLIKRGQDACLLCSDAGRPCTFDRLVRVQGPVSSFTWDALLAKESLDDVGHASSSINNPPPLNLLPNPNPNHEANIGDLSRNPHGATSSEARLSDLTHVFDRNLNSCKESRKRRVLSDIEEQRAARIRRTGACSECKAKKKKCYHVPDKDGSRAILPVPPVDSVPVYSMDSVGWRANATPIRHQSPGLNEGRPTSSGEQVSTVSEAQDSPKRQLVPIEAYRKPVHTKLLCLKCDLKPDGYSGESELRRHILRAHALVTRKWKCIDISEDGKFLEGCRTCRNGKLYGAYYNAAAHLRRRHFAPNSAGGEKDQLSAGHTKSGEEPSMDVLKKWMQEVEVEHDIGQNMSDPERDV